MTRRVDNWQFVLASELSKPRRFAWGSDDCCLFASDIIRALTGVDPAEAFRGSYSTALGAHKELKRKGYSGVKDLAEKMSIAFGFPAIPVLTAQRGDVALSNLEGQDTLGVVSDAGGVFIGHNGYVYLHPSKLQKAWRIS